MEALILFLCSLQADTVILENEHVKVTKNGASCAFAEAPGCGDRVVVALTSIEFRASGHKKKMDRGDIAVFHAGESYTLPAGGDFLEVAIKQDRPPVRSPSVLIPPEKNITLHDADRFIVFEERLQPGETRARHSHSQRVVIVLNETRLQQWPEGAAELVRTQIPDDVRFNPPVIHVVKNIGGNPLRNIVIEFKP